MTLSILAFNALHYKREGRGFYSQWCYWNFSSTWPLWQHYGSGVDSASNRHCSQKYFLEGKSSWHIGLTTLPPSCANHLEIWMPQPPGTLSTAQDCTGIPLPSPFAFNVYHANYTTW